MNKLTNRRFKALALFAVVAAIVVAPASASAQNALSNPSAAQYEPKSQVQGTSTTGSAASNSTGGGLNGHVGSLPFTGMDLIVLVVVAAGLIGTGVALRRLSAPKPNA